MTAAPRARVRAFELDLRLGEHQFPLGSVRGPTAQMGDGGWTNDRGIARREGCTRERKRNPLGQSRTEGTH